MARALKRRSACSDAIDRRLEAIGLIGLHRVFCSDYCVWRTGERKTQRICREGWIQMVRPFSLPLSRPPSSMTSVCLRIWCRLDAWNQQDAGIRLWELMAQLDKQT